MSASEGESAPRRFVVDTNVFVSAIRPFSKRGRKARTDTGSPALLLRLISDTELELFGNLWLLAEYKRLTEELSSETSELILGQLTEKMGEVAEIEDQAVARCRLYIPEQEAADIMHAATCLQANAVLITNDRDFDGIRESGVIEVWSITEAIRKLSIQRFSDEGIRMTRGKQAGSLLEFKGAWVGGDLDKVEKILERDREASSGRRRIEL